ncbi:MAG TPA: methyltransferase domain-containing protein [Terriglobales bacterium]|nr:methyltransferase domain-containing protein [Terriglobales bacterium]
MQSRRFHEAARLFGCVLGLEESAETWNDWAGAQWQLGQVEEALEGFRCALELDPSHAAALTNLAVGLAALGRWQEARPWLELARAGNPAATPESWLNVAREQAPELWDGDAAGAFLRRFAGQDPNTLDYFNTHLRRYVATLELTPPARPGNRLLELGAAFHHLTPALMRLRGYGDIACSDVWKGGRRGEHWVRSSDGQETFRFAVDNFNVEQAPWPYSDASFDLVLCCEILEHLSFDPMAMLSEIHRVLRPGGRLLLTTPNIASAKAVEYIANGESPYCWSQYEPEGLATDRHNREYTTSEVARLLAAAGFSPERLQTRNFYWRRPTAVRARLAAQGCSLAWRGDTTLALARKTGPVRERYPGEFYMAAGRQSKRRQAEAALAG